MEREQVETIICTIQKYRLTKVSEDGYKSITIGEPIHCDPVLCQAYGGPEKFLEAFSPETLERERQEIEEMLKALDNR